MILEPASLILPEFMENASLSFFGSESLFMSIVYLFFSKDEVYLQSIKPIYMASYSNTSFSQSGANIAGGEALSTNLF